MGFILTEAHLVQMDKNHEKPFEPVKEFKTPAEALIWADILYETQTEGMRAQLRQAVKDLYALQRKLTKRDKEASSMKQGVISLIERLQPCIYCVHKSDTSDEFESQGGCHACRNHGAPFFELDRSIDEVLREQ